VRSNFLFLLSIAEIGLPVLANLCALSQQKSMLCPDANTRLLIDARCRADDCCLVSHSITASTKITSTWTKDSSSSECRRILRWRASQPTNQPTELVCPSNTTHLYLARSALHSVDDGRWPGLAGSTRRGATPQATKRPLPRKFCVDRPQWPPPAGLVREHSMQIDDSNMASGRGILLSLPRRQPLCHRPSTNLRRFASCTLALTKIVTSEMKKNNKLTFWRPMLPYGYSYKASCARPG